jgi:hypothetical protein
MTLTEFKATETSIGKEYLKLSKGESRVFTLISIDKVVKVFNEENQNHFVLKIVDEFDNEFEFSRKTTSNVFKDLKENPAFTTLPCKIRIGREKDTMGTYTLNLTP